MKGVNYSLCPILPRIASFCEDMVSRILELVQFVKFATIKSANAFSNIAFVVKRLVFARGSASKPRATERITSICLSQFAFSFYGGTLFIFSSTFQQIFDRFSTELLTS